MAFFASPYTIHFDDTMAYGSHHFLTGFKFQCEARESLLYGDLIFDQPGTREALETIHLFTADAYSRNLSPTFLGDRLAIFVTLEEWGRVSTRFCYRVIGPKGQPICAGFQNLIVADATSGNPVPLPDALRTAFDALRHITEPDHNDGFFRDRVLKGTDATLRLFTDEIRTTAMQYLQDRYPHPRILEPVSVSPHDQHSHQTNTATQSYVRAPETLSTESVSNRQETADLTVELETPSSTDDVPEVWVFPGQGMFNARFFSELINYARGCNPEFLSQIEQSARITAELLGGDVDGLFSGDTQRCQQAVTKTPTLNQVAIHIQSVLSASLRRESKQPSVLLGHSFGEIAALGVSGCYDLATGVQVVCHRVRAVDDFGPADGELLVAKANRQVLAEEIALLGLSSLVVAGRNHEMQTVVSGLSHELDQLAAQLRSMNVETISISSPTCFHNPLLRDAATEWFNQLNNIPVGPPQSTIYSPIGRRIIDPAVHIPTMLSSQFIRTFDLQGALDDMVAAGYTRFVDCGSSGAFARLLKAAGPDSIEVVAAVSFPFDPLAKLTKSDLAQPSTPTGKFPPSDKSTPSSTAAASTPKIATASNSEPQGSLRPSIAIVGQGCLLPGGASSPSELHAAISQGKSGIHDKRQLDEYWEADFYSTELTADRSTSALVGLVNEEDIKCPANIDNALFAQFTRAQRLLCIALSPCIEILRASQRVMCLLGTTADGFQDQDTFSVLRYAGIAGNDPQVARRLGDKHSATQDPYAAVKDVFDRIVRPNLELTLIDAACASSLYAVTLGMHALENDEADIVLAGGLFCPGPGNNVLFSQFGGLTSTGCRPFDANADGVVFSEGAAVVVLQRESTARQQGREIAGIVRGAGLSSDGRSPSANVPQTSGQLHAVRRCYANYEIDPQTISAIEAHGTSTPVGDATEVRTLSRFFKDHAESPIPIHSLKGLLGHTGWAAGTASLIAATEAIRMQSFPGQATFRSPSTAIQEAEGVLAINDHPVRLQNRQARIAIDGFGFGGSNAHIVVERFDPHVDSTASGFSKSSNEDSTDNNELVVVAWHQLVPTENVPVAQGRIAKQFDREAVRLPEGMLLLPDLADDMDVSQSLALDLVGQTLSKINGFNDDMRRETGIVLAFGGKTERAVEATARVLSPRLARQFQDSPEAPKLTAAIERARQSGPYTLQCMMPNVSAGRAALQFNLNGPNFVVDAGSDSLKAAFAAAGSLLLSGEHSGTRLAIVAAIDANRWPVPGSDSDDSSNEYACAFAITTRGFAAASQLQIVDRLQILTDKIEAAANRTTESKVYDCIHALNHPHSPPPNRTVAPDPARTNVHKDEFPIHAPIWIESPISASPAPQQKMEKCLAIVLAKEGLIHNLMAELPKHAEHHLVVVVGEHADELARRVSQPNVVAADLTSEDQAVAALNWIEAFCPTTICAFDSEFNWNLEAALSAVAGNELCEMLFLTMKRLANRIRQQQTDVWALFPGGWDHRQQIIHPTTGAISGLLKSTRRELPHGVFGVLSHQSNSISDALAGLQFERMSSHHADVDIVHDGIRRMTRRLRAVDLDLTSPTPTPVQLDRDSVVVATGGARGVTAIMVEAILKDYGCTVVTLGRSVLEPGPSDFDSDAAEQRFYEQFLNDNPNATPVQMRNRYVSTHARWEAHNSIQQMAALDGNISYLTVDVTRPDDVDRVMAEIIEEFGRIDLVIHGAGVQWSKKIEDRKLSEFRTTFNVKVGGLKNLVSSARSHLGSTPPVHILTSAYSIFGNDGQHDYGAANEAMDRLCDTTRISDDGPAWTSIAWSAWNAIGMTRGSEYKALAGKRNLALLNPQDGQRVFRAVMQGITGSGINVPLSESERTRYRVRTIPPATSTRITRRIEMPVRLTDIACLPYHKARGSMTLPGAWTVDYMVRAASQLLDHPPRHFTVEDMKFVRFVRLTNEHDANIRVIVEGDTEGFSAWLIGDVINPAGITLVTDVVFASAKMTAGLHATSLTPQLGGELKNGHGDIRFVNDPYCAGDPSVDLSGPFDCLPEIEIGPLGRRATFSPISSDDWGGTVPAMLLDASLRVAGMHVVTDALHVPVSIDKVVIPTGISTDSYAARGWRIQTATPNKIGDDIRCERVEVLDEHGQLQLYVEGALVTQLK